MKVLCITERYLPSIGGMQLSNHETLLGLIESGIGVTLICPSFEGENDFDKKVPFEVIRKNKIGYIDQIKNLFFANKLYKYEKYDQVILMGHHTEIAYGLTKSFLSFQPIILAAGSRLPFKNKLLIVRVRNLLLKRAYNSAKKLIAINEYTIKCINKYCKTPLEKFTKIPRPINSKIFRFEKKLKQKTFTLITFCRIEKEKNIQDVIQILSNLKKNGHEFIYNIIGDGKYILKLKELCKKLNIEKEVVFHGAKTQLEIVKFLHKSDLHILLSHSESFGRVFAEAGFIKVPSIGYKGDESSAVSEIIKNNYNGFLYKFNEYIKIEKKLVEIIEDKNYLEKLSNNAFEFSKKNFDNKIISKKLGDFFKCNLK